MLKSKLFSAYGVISLWTLHPVLQKGYNFWWLPEIWSPPRILCWQPANSTSHSVQWLQKAPLFPSHGMAELFMNVQGVLKEKDEGFALSIHLIVISVVLEWKPSYWPKRKAIITYKRQGKNHCHSSVWKKNNEMVWKKEKVLLKVLLIF